VREMLKELESDKAAGRYIVWLRFNRVPHKHENRRTESLLQFFQLQGEFFCYNSLLISDSLCAVFAVCQQLLL